MKPLTASDVATMRFMRSKGQGAALIGQVFGARTMNELLDQLLALVPAEAATSRPDGLALALLPAEAEIAEIAASRHVVEMDRIPHPRGRDRGVQAGLIRGLLAAGRSVRQVADLMGCPRETVTALIAKDRHRRNKAAPPGAPAATEPLNAGTAAAILEATGQPRQGSDEVRPLREIGEAVQAPEPVNSNRQSDRPTTSLGVTGPGGPIPAPHRALEQGSTPLAPPPVRLPAPARPPVAPPRVANPGSALDLAAMAAEALRTGAVKVTRCPTACAAETAGVKVSAEDAAAMRRRHDALADRHWSWRGQKAATNTTNRSTL